MDHLLRPLLEMVCGSSVTNSIRPFFAASFKYYVIVKNFKKSRLQFLKQSDYLSRNFKCQMKEFGGNFVVYMMEFLRRQSRHYEVPFQTPQQPLDSCSASYAPAAAHLSGERRLPTCRNVCWKRLFNHTRS